MLYTDQPGDRKIRIFNYKWQVSKNLYQLFKSADPDLTAQIKLRTSLASMPQLGAKRSKENIINDTIEMLFQYRKHCNNSAAPTQLVLPETLRPFPLFILSALKSPVSPHHTQLIFCFSSTAFFKNASLTRK